jgi:carboxymethylenebutenolidase
MAALDTTGLTRRQVLAVGGATFAGYALAADTVLAQVVKTDTDGLVAGDAQVKIGDYSMPVYQARPASGSNHPIVLLISEVWGVHEWVKDVTRRFAKQGYMAVAPELFQREGGVGQLTDIQAILKIVFAVPRKQLLGDIAAAGEWAKKQPGVRADRVGVTGWCWGGGVVYQVAATNPDVKAAVAWYGVAARPFPDTPSPVTGFDVAKDIKIPFLGLYGETDKSPSPEDVKKLEELMKAGNKNVEVRDLSRGGPRVLRRLPALLQRGGRRRRVEAVHGVLRQVAEGRRLKKDHLLVGALAAGQREGAMPFVNIRIYEGHGKDRKDEIASRVTDAICDVTKLPREAVWVIIEDIDPPDWYVGGKPGERMRK